MQVDEVDSCLFDRLTEKLSPRDEYSKGAATAARVTDALPPAVTAAQRISGRRFRKVQRKANELSRPLMRCGPCMLPVPALDTEPYGSVYERPP